MNVRAFLIIPAALAMGVLAGCGLTDGVGPAGDGSTRVKMPSTEVCHESAYIRERAPEGACTSEAETGTGTGTGAGVVDDLSPIKGR